MNNRFGSKRRPLLVAGVILGLALVATSVTSAQEAPVGLGTAESFAVLAGAGVTNTGPTVVSGDLGACPTPAVSGFPPGTVINGTIHGANPLCFGAQSDLTTAYIDAAGRAPTTDFPGVKDLGGLTLTPGVYKADAFTITGTLTLDAQGDPNAVWIFQAGSTLITATNSRVVLINGAQPCNVFWQVGSSATLGVGSTFVGTILALTSITANTNATVQGRLLARNGAVTLDSNTVTRPVCAPTPTTTSSTTTSSTTSTSTTSTSTTSTSTTVPPITVPPITVPPITVPPITVPPVTLPDITIPDITIPDITIPDITIPDITIPDITIPDITLPTTTLPDITVPTTTTSTSTTVPGGTTTSSTSTTLPASTTTTTQDETDTPGAGSPSSTTSTVPATSTTTSTTSTTAASTTTSVAGSADDDGGVTRATTAPGVEVASAGTTGTLARTGSSMSWAQFWAGLTLAVGGLMVLLAREEIPARRRQSKGR